VYDLQVEPYGLYTCNGAIVHNCECYETYQRKDSGDGTDVSDMTSDGDSADGG
jgi:hypothetical protein